MRFRFTKGFMAGFAVALSLIAALLAIDLYHHYPIGQEYSHFDSRGLDFLNHVQAVGVVSREQRSGMLNLPYPAQVRAVIVSPTNKDRPICYGPPGVELRQMTPLDCIKPNMFGAQEERLLAKGADWLKNMKLASR